jgi:hypothetical protein
LSLCAKVDILGARISICIDLEQVNAKSPLEVLFSFSHSLLNLGNSLLLSLRLSWLWNMLSTQPCSEAKHKCHLPLNCMNTIGLILPSIVYFLDQNQGQSATTQLSNSRAFNTVHPSPPSQNSFFTWPWVQHCFYWVSDPLNVSCLPDLYRLKYYRD